QLQRRQLGVNVSARRAWGGPIKHVAAIVAQRLIKGMAYVDSSNVPVAGPSDVVRVDAVGRHVSNRGRTNKKPVFIEMPAGVILVVVIAELGCVALKQKVLPIQVADAHRMLAA